MELVFDKDGIQLYAGDCRDVLPTLITAQPKTAIAPYRWRYEEVRPHLLESAKVITAMPRPRRAANCIQSTSMPTPFRKTPRMMTSM